MSKAAARTIKVLGVLFLVIAIGLLIGYIGMRDVHTDTLVEDTKNKVSSMFGEEDKTIVLGGQQYKYSGAVKTYLLLGTDASGNEEGVGDEYQGSMADVLMLLVVNEEEKDYGLLQLNRDTITWVPLMQADGSAYVKMQMQLCIAHWYGGSKEASCENTVNTVSEMLGGITIDGYFCLQMDAIPLLNQIVDGVTVTFEEDLTELDPAMEKGATLTLTDEQAWKLIRARSEMEDERNTQRMSRQRLFLRGFMEAMSKKQDEDSEFIIRVYDTLLPYATENLNMNKIAALANQKNAYTSKGLYSIEGESIIGQTLGDGVDHWEFYMEEESLYAVMNELFSLEYSETAEEGK